MLFRKDEFAKSKVFRDVALALRKDSLIQYLIKELHEFPMIERKLEFLRKLLRILKLPIHKKDKNRAVEAITASSKDEKSFVASLWRISDSDLTEVM